jgi:hypothetical protein
VRANINKQQSVTGQVKEVVRNEKGKEVTQLSSTALPPPAPAPAPAEAAKSKALPEKRRQSIIVNPFAAISESKPSLTEVKESQATRLSSTGAETRLRNSINNSSGAGVMTNLHVTSTSSDNITVKREPQSAGVVLSASAPDAQSINNKSSTSTRHKTEDHPPPLLPSKAEGLCNANGNASRGSKSPVTNPFGALLA